MTRSLVTRVSDLIGGSETRTVDSQSILGALNTRFYIARVQDSSSRTPVQFSSCAVNKTYCSPFQSILGKHAAESIFRTKNSTAVRVVDIWTG